MPEEVVNVTRSYHIQYPNTEARQQLLYMLERGHVQHFAGENQISARCIQTGEVASDFDDIRLNPEKAWQVHILLTEIIDHIYSPSAHYKAAEFMQKMFGVDTSQFYAFKELTGEKS